MPVFIAPVAGALSDRIGGRALLATGLGLQAIGLGWLAAVASPTVPYLTLVPAFVVSGVGMSLFFAPVANVVLGSVRRDQEGIASGANNAIREGRRIRERRAGRGVIRPRRTPAGRRSSPAWRPRSGSAGRRWPPPRPPPCSCPACAGRKRASRNRKRQPEPEAGQPETEAGQPETGRPVAEPVAELAQVR